MSAQEILDAVKLGVISVNEARKRLGISELQSPTANIVG